MSIGFLFVTQMLTLRRNITTLESYVEGIKKVVSNDPIQAPWRKSTLAKNIEEVTGTSSWLCPTVPFPRRTHYMSVEF